jgi:hypothetical protein
MTRCELNELPEALGRLIQSNTIVGLRDAWSSRSEKPCDLRSHGADGLPGQNETATTRGSRLNAVR